MKSIKQLLPLLALLLTLYSCGGETTADTKEMVTEAKETVTEADFGGLALYSLRDTMAGDPKSVLQEVADMGYANIEAAGYKDGKFYGMEPAVFKGYLDEVGLKPVSSHNSSITLENADQTIADVKAAGFQYLVIPIPPMGHFEFDAATKTLGMNGTLEEVMGKINEIAKKCSAQGIECLYHNHDFEFRPYEGDVKPMDYFIENSDPAHLNFQIDLYWATKAGADPVAYFDKAPGRFKAWHVKDMDDMGRFAPVGKGNIDFARIVAAKEKSGMLYYFVEQDMMFNHEPLEAVKISHGNLKGFGFE
jgi:sugar phosphate isomerase/epimerase